MVSLAAGGDSAWGGREEAESGGPGLEGEWKETDPSSAARNAYIHSTHIGGCIHMA